MKLRYFVGLNRHEISEALGVNEKTVRRHWEVAKVRLLELMVSVHETLRCKSTSGLSGFVLQRLMIP